MPVHPSQVADKWEARRAAAPSQGTYQFYRSMVTVRWQDGSLVKEPDEDGAREKYRLVTGLIRKALLDEAEKLAAAGNLKGPRGEPAEPDLGLRFTDYTLVKSYAPRAGYINAMEFRIETTPDHMLVFYRDGDPGLALTLAMGKALRKAGFRESRAF